MLKSNIVQVIGWPLASFVCGSVMALSMAPLHWVAFLFLGFSGFYFCLARSRSNLQGAFCGLLFGFGFFLFGLSWIANALLVEGGNFAWAWPLAVCGLPAALGVFYGLAAYGIRRWFFLDKVSGFVAFCAVFAFTDWVRGHVFTGFPWNLFAYSWGEMLEILQLLSLGNVYYLNLLSIGWASVAGFLFLSGARPRRKIIIGVVAAASIALSYGFGVVRLQEHETRYIPHQYIKVVQPNILQHEKWARDKMQGHYNSLISLSAMKSEDALSAEDSVLVIWPETASSSFVLELDYNQYSLSSMLSGYAGEAYLLSGVLAYQDAENFSNAAALYDSNADEVNLYKKSRLVPFGEFIPFQKWIPITPVTQFNGFTRGDGASVQALPSGLTYQMLICYEVIFPGFLDVESGARPDILVNVTNDAWYGKSAGPYQHLLHARYRAIESGIPVIRSANTGISALFDPAGRILYTSGLFIEESKLLRVPENIPVLLRSPLSQDVFFLFIVIGTMIGGLSFGMYSSNRN